ncbi:MAG: hypothetical protein IPP42_24790 [Saprospiraceae bacterium]|nr:hypothetical protein [Saprospiraceae bacterium]
MFPGHHRPGYDQTVISCPAAITVYEDALCLADTTTTKTLKATATDNLPVRWSLPSTTLIAERMALVHNYTINRT